MAYITICSLFIWKSHNVDKLYSYCQLVHTLLFHHMAHPSFSISLSRSQQIPPSTSLTSTVYDDMFHKSLDQGKLNILLSWWWSSSVKRLDFDELGYMYVLCALLLCKETVLCETDHSEIQQSTVDKWTSDTHTQTQIFHLSVSLDPTAASVRAQLRLCVRLCVCVM